MLSGDAVSVPRSGYALRQNRNPGNQTPEPINRTSVPVWLNDVLDPKSFSSLSQIKNLENCIVPVSPSSLRMARRNGNVLADMSIYDSERGGN